MRAIVLAVVVLGLCSARASSVAPAQPARSVAGPARHVVGPARFIVSVPSRVWPNPGRVESVDAHGRVIRIIARKMYRALVSPNRKLVAFDDHTGLHVARIRGSGSGRLVTRNVPAEGDAIPYYVWSPGSKKLLVSTRSGRLAVITVASGAERLLPRPVDRSHVDYPFGWSGQAHKIFFESTCIEQGWHDCWGLDLVAASPTGASPHTIYDYPGGDSEPAASSSPDGKWLALTQVSHDDPASSTLFEVINVKSGKTTFPDPQAFYPAVDFPLWAPDSRRFALSGEPTGPPAPLSPVAVFSSGGDLLSWVNPSGSPIAWTRAGLYLIDESGKLVLVPRGRTKAKTFFSPPGEVQPLR